MPNFEVRITAGASRAVWVDEPTETKPSRLNADQAKPHTYRQCTVGEAVTISAVVDGVVSPMDVDLGGEEFLWWVGEVPQWPAPALASPAGQSSVITLTPQHPGHHLVVALRSNGGRVLVPFEAIGT